MGLGAPIFGLNRLLTSNAVVDVEAGTVAPAGGSVFSWAAAVSDVDVLITQASSGRDYQTGTSGQRTSYSVSGVEPSLARPDVRLKVTSCPDLPDLEGRYLSVVSTTKHPAGRGGLLAKRINLQCVVLELPGNAGAE